MLWLSQEEEGCEAAEGLLYSVAGLMGAKERHLGRGCQLHNSHGAVWEMLSYNFMRERK